MNRTTSLYLDLVRFLAAAMVLLSHAATRQRSGGLLWQVIPLGKEAVVVFFVLSGFVIGYVTAEHELSARTYMVNRLARLYSVAVPAIVLTALLDLAGRTLRPDLYAMLMGYVPSEMPWQSLNGLLFTNQVWFNHIPIGSNGPYWSLGYEVPYYVAFGVAAFAPRVWGLFGTALILLAAGPNVASLFPMWLLGFAGYRLCVRCPLGTGAGLAVWTVSSIALAFVVLPPRPLHPLSDDLSLTADRLHDLLHAYCVAILFALNIIGFRGASPLFLFLLDRFAQPIRWCGQRTFSLYLFHYPLMQFMVAVAPWRPATWQTRALVFLAVPPIAFALAEVTERRKLAWRRWLDMLLPRSGKVRLIP